MSRQNKKNGIPDRWLDYKAVGKRLDGTRFIAFKVPLKQTLNRQLSRSDVFGPWELMDTLNRENQELGLIIDLTFTTRYYNLHDVPDSLEFVKIFTAGHEIPSDKTILSFKRAVRQFLQDNADNDRLIGVHCTHGLNRTGYLICRYLIDVDGMDPKEAVELFNSSRGHSIERENYLEDLRCGPQRSNDGMDESEQEPMRGEATHRPTEREREREDRDRDMRRPHSSDSRHHRSLPPRGTDHRSHHHHDHDPYPHNGHLPRAPLLPPPPVGPPPGAPFHHPYRWAPPHPDSQWRRPPRSEEGRSRYPPARREWSPSSAYRQDDRRRAPPSPPRHHSHHHHHRHHHHHQQHPRPAAPPPPPPLLSRYTPRWTNESNSYSRSEEKWAGPRVDFYR